MSLSWTTDDDVELQGSPEDPDEELSDQEFEDDDAEIEVFNYPIQQTAHRKVNPSDYAISGQFSIGGILCIVCETFLGDCYICPVDGKKQFDEQKCNNSYMENIHRIFNPVTNVVCQVDGDRILYNNSWISTQAPFIDVGVIPILSEAPLLDDQISHLLRMAFAATQKLAASLLNQYERELQETSITNTALVNIERNCRKNAMAQTTKDETYFSRLRPESPKQKRDTSLNLRMRRSAIASMTRKRAKFISDHVKFTNELNDQLQTQIVVEQEALLLSGKTNV